MRYKDEQYVLNTLDTIRKETHENNIMLRQLIAYFNKEIESSNQYYYGRNI